MGFLLDRLWPFIRAQVPLRRHSHASLERLPHRDFQDLNLPEEVRARIMEQRLRDMGMGRW